MKKISLTMGVIELNSHGSDSGGKRLSVVCEERLVLLAANLDHTTPCRV